MKPLVFVATAIFVAAVAFIAALGSLEVPRSGERDKGIEISRALAKVSAAELARHNSRADCWIAVHGEVYDVTRYIDEHPAPTATIVNVCGTDATVSFDTKERGRPHSQHAWELLRTMRVGSYSP